MMKIPVLRIGVSLLAAIASGQERAARVIGSTTEFTALDIVNTGRSPTNRISAKTAGLAAAGMNVDYDADARERDALQKMRNPVRQAAASITWERTVHIHAVQRR